MRISVVIPVYNSAPHLSRTLESVLNQTVQDWELVIVDDGSADGSEDIARRYAARDPRVRLVAQANTGMAAARNRGLTEADSHSKAVVFLDHDDEWHADALELLEAALDANPEAVAASGLSRCIDAASYACRLGEIESWGRQRRGVVGRRLADWPLDSPTTLAVLAYRNCIATTGVALIRRRALDEAGPFDPAAAPCDDWDMWLRLSQRGDIAFINKVLLDWRAHGANTSSKNALVVSKQRYVRRKVLSSPWLTRDQRRLVAADNRFWGRRVYTTWLSLATYSLAIGRPTAAVRQLCSAAASYVQWRGGLPLP